MVEEDDAYIERVASVMRKSRQEFATCKSYQGSEMLFEMLTSGIPS